MVSIIAIFLFTMGTAQAIFFALFFFVKKKKNLLDKIAGTWLLILAIQFLLIIAIHYIHNNLKKQFLIDLELSFTLIHGPFFLLYVKRCLTYRPGLKLYNWLHYIPFVATLTLVLFFSGTTWIKFVPIAGTISGISYMSYTIFLIHIKRSKYIKNTDNIQMFHWLSTLTIGLIITWIFPLTLANISRMLELHIVIDAMYFTLPLFIYYLSFKSWTKLTTLIQHKPIETIKAPSETEMDGKNTAAEPYKKSKLDKEDMKKIFTHLENTIKKEKLFLMPNLNLSDLSEHIKTPAHHITQALNVYANQNFSELINSYRVNEFKRKVITDEYKNFSLFGVAMDCGFNSKPSFHRIFKKHTGLTPAEYKNNVLPETDK